MSSARKEKEEEKKSLLQRILDWVRGEGEPYVEDSGKEDKTSDPEPSRSIDPLFARLDRDLDREPEIRLLMSNELNSNKLVTNLLSLMFKLSPSKNKLITDNWLVEQLSERSNVRLYRNVFYIYADASVSIASWEEIRDDVYAKLIDLTGQSEAVYKFVNERFVFRWQRAHGSDSRRDETFDATDTDHKEVLPYAIPIQVCVYLKDFPDAGKHNAYIVGRRPIHDSDEILRHEKRRARINTAQEATDVMVENLIAKVAATVVATGKHKGHFVIFNAHRFSTNDAGTRIERKLYIGDLRAEWELSIGAAEHDEIQCPALGEASAKVTLRNLRLDGNSWHYEYRVTGGLPRWFEFKDSPVSTEVDDDNILAYVRRHPTTDSRLLNYIDRTEFKPEIRLTARVLHADSAEQIEYFKETAGQAIQAVIRDLKLVSAIEVQKDSLWVVRADKGEVFQVVKTGVSWSRSELKDGDIIALGDYRYQWRKAVGDLVPERFCGLVYIFPPDNQRQNFIQSLVVDKDAGDLPIAQGTVVSDKPHQDVALGSYGVVSLKGEESRDGRPTYAFIPIREARNKFFAFHPAVRPAGHRTGWLFYDEDSEGKWIGDLKIVDGRAAYSEKVVLVEGANNTIVCGTSLFQIKASGTPLIGYGAAAHAPSRRAGQGTLALPSPEEMDFDPLNLADVKLRLQKTGWGRYKPEWLSKSNVAAHYLLKSEGDERFLKVYYQVSAANGEREVMFYYQYKDRAEELFLNRPDEVLQEDEEASPWALVFPRLTSIEDQQPRIAQAAAIGYGLATLFGALSEDRLINYDIDQSMLCVNEQGRLVVVDFDNVYPILTGTDDLKALSGILNEKYLPAKNPNLPPEARAFHIEAQKGDYEAGEALKQIGAPFSTYMLAVVLLQMTGLAESPRDGHQDDVTFSDELLVSQAQLQESNRQAAEKLAALLRRMLSLDSRARPEPAEVVSQMGDICRELAAGDPRDEEDISKLLGSLPAE